MYQRWYQLGTKMVPTGGEEAKLRETPHIPSYQRLVLLRETPASSTNTRECNARVQRAGVQREGVQRKRVQREGVQREGVQRESARGGTQTKVVANDVPVFGM